MCSVPLGYIHHQLSLNSGTTINSLEYVLFAGRRGFDLDTLCKQFERKAVLDLTVCEEQDVIFCVSDGQMAAHYLSAFFFTGPLYLAVIICYRSEDRHYPVVSILHKTKPVNEFVVWFPEVREYLTGLHFRFLFTLLACISASFSMQRDKC